MLVPERAYGSGAARQQRGQRFVYSEVDFRRAITLLLADLTTVGGRPFSGGGLVFAGTFEVTRPLVIPAECAGVTIFAAARFPIFPVGVVASLFDVRAPLVTIRDLLCASRSATHLFSAFVTVGNSGADHLRVLDNYVVADRVYVESATNDPNDCQVIGNVQSHISGTHAAPIVVHGGRAKIERNNVADGGGDGITVGAGGDFASIKGNDLRGADITTSASDGHNVIDGNTQCGTITSHATDAVGLNT